MADDATDHIRRIRRRWRAAAVPTGTAFGIPERHVIAYEEGGVDLEADDHDAVRLWRNGDIHSQHGGVWIADVYRTDEFYRIEIPGHPPHVRLSVTEGGVEAFGRALLGEQDEIPEWLLDPTTVDGDDPPTWVPDVAEMRHDACNSCGDPVRVGGRVTREGAQGQIRAYCDECWRRVSR